AADVVDRVRTAALLSPPAAVPGVAPRVAPEIAWAARLARPAPAPPVGLAGPLASRIAREAGAQAPVPGSPPPPVHNPAPLLLVSGLLAGLTLLAVTTAWPNLAAGATVLQTLVAQVSPLAGVGLALLLAVSVLVAWRPTPAVQRFGAGAFVLAAVLTLPPLYEAFARSGVTVGHDVTVRGAVSGNVIAVGGHVTLAPGARVDGEVITLLGDVRREPGAQVSGRVNALLGHAPGDASALETAPPPGLSVATATAFRPLLGWLGGAAWSRVFVVLTGAMLLGLFVAGVAPMLARRQRHAPLRTLALGVLALALLIGPALGLALVGLLVPALLATAFALLTVATGLSVTAYDAGRALAYRLRLPLPDAVGALLGLCTVAASLSVPPLALVLVLVGGAWGAGTLLLTRQGQEAGGRFPA
ncbi:polymer-forming cytoskeletal protein, partial [Deinococcus planocerae]|uniref:polymer-forming cytoskeletal protein n=1 Tax=Deinococcus planocerae TaxID=1737569 RepID=UPI001FE8D76D